ncbi:HEPN domain-containing protein [Halobacillus massiliensis]|uniref:HEPN domain-containing protein n=1 Tax=Halobacillus massiliensis TaxID=1926286 RepID=UPI0009E4707B|nr:HEPN domain-containing protein [Halobacillus massiliensis]
MKEINEIAKIFYKGKTFNGYIKVNEKEKYLEFLIEDIPELRKELLDFTTSKMFHCRLHNYKTISCFKCNLINNRNDKVITYKIGTYIDEYIQNYEDISFNKVYAIFPKLDSWFIGNGNNLKLSSEIIYKGKKITVSTNQGRNEDNNLYSQTTTTYLTLALECDELLDIDFINSFLFKFSTVFSFLCDSFVTYQYLLFKSEKGMSAKIYQTNLYDSNTFKLINVNYRPRNILNDREFKQIFLDPINSELFDVWANYVSIIRFHNLLEEQYLGYARCLEILSRNSIDNFIYDDDERRLKASEYKKLINGMDLDTRYKNNLKEAFKYSNRKGFKGLLIDYLQTFSFKDQLENLYDSMDLKILVKNIVDLRDHLTHGLAINAVDNDSLFFYIRLSKHIVANILLKKQHIQSDQLDIGYLTKQYKFLPKPFKN